MEVQSELTFIIDMSLELHCNPLTVETEETVPSVLKEVTLKVVNTVDPVKTAELNKILGVIAGRRYLETGV